jgi:hypothetical protein
MGKCSADCSDSKNQSSWIIAYSARSFDSDLNNYLLFLLSLRELYITGNLQLHSNKKPNLTYSHERWFCQNILHALRIIYSPIKAHSGTFFQLSSYSLIISAIDYTLRKKAKDRERFAAEREQATTDHRRAIGSRLLFPKLTVRE